MRNCFSLPFHAEQASPCGRSGRAINRGLLDALLPKLDCPALSPRQRVTLSKALLQLDAGVFEQREAAEAGILGLGPACLKEVEVALVGAGLGPRRASKLNKVLSTCPP